MDYLENKKQVLFSKIRPGDPTSVITLVCHFINTWSKLQKNGLQKLLLQGARKMAHVAQEVFGQNHGWNHVRRRITT
jgi:hypothetical protein